MKNFNSPLNTVAIIAIFFSILIVGCKTSTNNHKKAIVVDLAENQSDEIYDNIILLKDAIPLETNDNCILGGINKIILEENKMIFVDFMKTQSTLYFDKEGNFVDRLSKIGKSKGEYVFNRDFVEKGNSNGYYLFDRNMDKLLEFDSDLNFIKEEKVPISINSLVALSDGSYIVEMSSENPFFINIYDNDFKLIKKSIPRPNYQLHYDFNNPYPFKTKQNGIVTYNPSFSNFIYSYDGKNFKEKYYISDTKGFPDEDFFEDNKGVHPSRILKRFKEQNYISFLDYYENDDYLLLKYYRGNVKNITIYQKNYRKATTYKSPDNSFESIVLNNVIGIDSIGRFVSYIFPYQYINTIDEQNLNNQIPQLDIWNIDEQNNPIILFFLLNME